MFVEIKLCHEVGFLTDVQVLGKLELIEQVLHSHSENEFPLVFASFFGYYFSQLPVQSHAEFLPIDFVNETLLFQRECLNTLLVYLAALLIELLKNF